jgi:uncharacterized alkaline shock family protein YloU
MVAGAVPEPIAEPGADRIAPEVRGRTRIADRVLARIAARAAREALALHTAEPELLAVPHSSAGQRRRGTSVQVGVELPYPADIGAVTHAVHRQVVDRLAELAGTENPRVTLVVERLVPAAPSERVR